MLATVLFAIACGKQDPEQAVRARLDVLQAAIDARDASAIEDMLDPGFIGQDGMDRPDVRRLAAGMFLRYRDAGARFGPVSVEVRGEREVVARFGVLATGGNGGMLPEQGQLFRVETGWRLVDGGWMLLHATWKPAMQ